MRRQNPLVYFIISLSLASALLVVSLSGLLGGVQGIAAAPLFALTGLFTRGGSAVMAAGNELYDVESLRQRNRDLQRQLAALTGEVVQLREIAADYERLAQLLNYTTANRDMQFIAADVLGVDQQGLIRAIIINKGTRDGVRAGMPVVTELGLVGRIFDVTANAARVQLITDQNSFVSGRLQTSRAEGSVQGRGLLTGNLIMRYIPVDAPIIIGDLVFTSGLGGNFPPNIVIGQVTSRQSFEFELSQEAQLTSLIDFNRLELVLVVTNFEAADLRLE